MGMILITEVRGNDNGGHVETILRKVVSYSFIPTFLFGRIEFLLSNKTRMS